MRCLWGRVATYANGPLPQPLLQRAPKPPQPFERGMRTPQPCQHTCRHCCATGVMPLPRKAMSRITAFITYSFSELSGCLNAAKRLPSSCCANGAMSAGVNLAARAGGGRGDESAYRWRKHVCMCVCVCSCSCVCVCGVTSAGKSTHQKALLPFLTPTPQNNAGRKAPVPGWLPYLLTPPSLRARKRSIAIAA